MVPTWVNLNTKYTNPARSTRSWGSWRSGCSITAVYLQHTVISLLTKLILSYGRVHGKPCQNRPVCFTQLDFSFGHQYYQNFFRNLPIYVTWSVTANISLSASMQAFPVYVCDIETEWHGKEYFLSIHTKNVLKIKKEKERCTKPKGSSQCFSGKINKIWGY